MRGASLRIKINAAIFLAFVTAAVVCGSLLHLYMADRVAAVHNRTRALLAAVAVHRLEALAPLLQNGQDTPAIQDILDRLRRVEGVTDVSLFDASGGLVAHAGQGAPDNRLTGQLGSLPTGRISSISLEKGFLFATLIEPVPGANGPLGYLRLSYSLQPLHQFHQRLWLLFGIGLAAAYALMAVLLNLLLHRFVVHPVETLRQALEAVERGQLDQSVPVTSKDALGRAARAFNAMAARLRQTSDSLNQSQAEVAEQHRLLETRVATRTAELAMANEHLMAEIQGRRQAEESLRQALAQRDALLGNSQVGLATIRGRICLDINRRGAEILGYAREDLIGQSSRLVFGDETDFLITVHQFDQLLADEGTINLERQLRRRDGSLVWVRVHGKTVIGKDPAQDVVWAFDDITLEKERQARLEQARREAEQASRAKGSFLAVMSHEIRTPLNAIMGLTELLLAKQTSSEQREHLRTIQDSASHLNGIINDILDFSKIEAGKLVLDRVDFNLLEQLDAVTRVMDIQARRKGLTFTVNVDPDAPDVLRGDPGRLRQVLLNLLGNAVKFTEQGFVSLTVERASAETAPEGTVGLTARIADSGIGIAADRLADLFTSFQQGSGSIARRFGGTGLGLAISKEIVERMGGTITVRSTEGQGSAFTFTVFMLPGDPTRVKTRQLTPNETPVGACARLSILLVEDNALNAAVTRLHIGRMGHDLTVASSAAQAYVELARKTYDVVLMDIEMPDIDGITATRAIRAGGPDGAATLDPHVPIVAVTAHAVEDVRQQCLEAGMNGFVTKPINYRVLEATLRSLGQSGQSPASPPPPPPPEPNAAALFDPRAAREAMGITWEQYASLSKVSFAEGRKRLEEAREALAQGNVERASIAAHTFKGIAATLGGYACRELAIALEWRTRDNDLQAATPLLDRIDAQWEQVGEALAHWRAPTDQEPA